MHVLNDAIEEALGAISFVAASAEILVWSIFVDRTPLERVRTAAIKYSFPVVFRHDFVVVEGLIVVLAKVFVVV